MSKSLFVSQPICGVPVICERCRDRERGAKLRRQWATAFEVPPAAEGDAPEDFICPRDKGGKHWGWKRPYEIPADFNPTVERRRLKSGGCCGKPSQSSAGET